MTDIRKIKELIDGMTPQDALSTIEKALAENPDNADLLIEKGKIYWKLDERGAALSAYEQAALIDPEGPAKLLLDHSNAIMDFFNPDLLNP